MARICIEYECELQECQRRPANLLDALERGDHRGGEDDDAAVGEEKVVSSLFSHLDPVQARCEHPSLLVHT